MLGFIERNREEDQSPSSLVLGRISAAEHSPVTQSHSHSITGPANMLPVLEFMCHT